MRETSILLLDPDPSGGLGRELCGMISSTPGEAMRVRCEELQDIKSAAEIIKREHPDLVCLILGETVRDALPRLRGIREALGAAPMMVVTSAREPDELFGWLKLGAIDFITPPLKPFNLLPRIWRLVDQSRRVKTEEVKLKEQIGLAQLIGKSKVFQETVEKLPFIAQCDSSVLISGETGTGKEVCARAIHYLGARSGRSFIPVNC